MVHIAQRLVDPHSGGRAVGFLRFIVLIVGLGVVLVAADGLSSMRGNGRPSPAPSGGAGSTPPLSVGVGPFWYTRTIGTMRHPFCLKQEIIRSGYSGRCDLTVWFEVEMSTETWVGVDGTMRERTVEAWQRFASPADRARWTAHRKRLPPPVSVDQGDGLVIGEGHFPPDLFGDNGGDVPPIEGPPTGSGPVDVGDSLFTYAQLLSLPDSPTAAVRRIDQAEAALHRRYAQTLRRWHSPGADLQARRTLTPQPRGIRSIEDLLAISHLLASPVPPGVRLALFHAATALPGVSVTPDARDSLGRTGVRVSASYPHWQTAAFVFDPGTGELLTGLPFAGGPPDVAGPATTVVARGEVATVTALPAGVKPIQAVSAPPLWPAPREPRMIAISPPTGRPNTVFTLTLAGVSGERPHPAPTVWIGITDSGATSTIRRTGTPVDPCLSPYSVQVRPATTTRRAGQLVYIFRVGPGLLQRRDWCVGRYELGVTTFPNPIPWHYTTPPYVGPSGTSIYFRIR